MDDLNKTAFRYGHGNLVGLNFATAVCSLWVLVHDENPVRSVETKTENTTLQTQDRVGLTGLTLEERKYFLDGIQQLLDENNINLNARELRYSGGITQPLNVQGKGGNYYDVADLIRENSDLKELMMKSGRVHANRIANDSSAQEYKVLVTDSSGNKLPADQIIIEAGDGSRRIQMSVDEFKQMDRTAISVMLL